MTDEINTKGVTLSTELAQKMLDNNQCSVTVDADQLQHLIETGDVSPLLLEQLEAGLNMHYALNGWLRKFIESQSQEPTP